MREPRKCSEIVWAVYNWGILQIVPPAGAVLLVVIGKTVQHMPAIWQGDEWTWLDSRDEDEPILDGLITHWRPLPAPPVSKQEGE